jgi:hypothetical protein
MKDRLHQFCADCLPILGIDYSYDRSADYRFVVPRGDILKLLRRGESISAQFLKKCDMLDRETALLLLQNKVFYSSMREYVTVDDVRALLIHSNITRGDDSLAAIFPEIYDSHTLNMVLIELHYIGRADIIKRYSEWGNEYRKFSRDLQNLYKDRFAELYPLIILDGMYKVTDELSDDLLDLLDRAIAFETPSAELDKIYADHVESWLICGENEFTAETILRIIEKYPRYLGAFLSNISISAQTDIWNKHNKTEFIMNHAAYDYFVLIHLPDDAFGNIGAEILNAYIRNKFNGTMNTLSDMCKIKYGIDLDDATISRSPIHVKEIISDIYFKIKVCNINHAQFEVSCGHMLTLARNNAAFLDNMIPDDIYQHILPQMYHEFIGGMCIIFAACAKMAIPRDIADIIKLYYIKPDADSDDIARMLRSFDNV